MEGQIAFGANPGADAADLAAFRVDDGVGLPGIERPGDPFLRTMTGLRFLSISASKAPPVKCDPGTSIFKT